jgi:mannose-6-phosphate isomerase-like protein (cupin superfamily)
MSHATSHVETCDIQNLNLHGSGPQWGTASDDLNITLLSWEKGKGVGAHVNNDLDVVIVVVSGEGEMKIEGEEFELVPGRAVLVPKGANREIESRTERLTYFSIHRRRAGLMPTSL